MESGQARVPFVPEAEDMTPGQVHVLDRQVGKKIMKNTYEQHLSIFYHKTG